jgi:transcriptional regulator with XRE-family HTH domain
MTSRDDAAVRAPALPAQSKGGGSVEGRRPSERRKGGAAPLRGNLRANSLGTRIKALRLERELQQRQLAEKAELTPSMVSQIESGRLTPSLHTVGKIAAALAVPIASLFDAQPAGHITITRKKDYPMVSFDGSQERWSVLGAGLFQGKIRAVVSTLDTHGRGVSTDKVVIQAGQMKLFYVLEGKVALHYNGDRHVLGEGDSGLLDGGIPHGWENLGPRRARALWVILG